MRPDLLRQLAVTLIVPSAPIVLHELGHHLSHAAFGYETYSISYDGAAAGAPPTTVPAQLADGVSFAAGTLVSLALVLLAAWARLPTALAIALVAFELVRATIGVAMAVADRGLAVLWGGTGELRYLAKAFAWPPPAGALLGLLELAVPLLVAMVVWRRLPPDRRLWQMLTAVGGSLLGLGLWLNIVGPVVLP